MPKVQFTNNDTVTPVVGDLAAMSTQPFGAVLAIATTATVNVLGVWSEPAAPGYVGTIDNDLVEVNCVALPALGDKLFVSAATAGKATNVAPTNGYYIGTALSVRTSGSTYKATINFNKANGIIPPGQLPAATSLQPGAVPAGTVIVDKYVDDAFDPTTSGLAAAFGAKCFTFDGTKWWRKYGPAATAWALNGIAPLTRNVQSGTSYTVLTSDFTSDTLVVLTSASAVAFTLPDPAGLALPIGRGFAVMRKGAGKPTFSAGAGATIDNADGKLSVAAVNGVVYWQISGTHSWEGYGALST